MSIHTVIVTGGTKGLGRAVALTFARTGHQVVALYSSDETAAVALRADLGAWNSSSMVVKHDIAVEDAGLWRLPEIQGAESLVLINSAWVPFSPKPSHLLSWADFERQLSVGLRGSWLCATALLRLMVRCRRGAIVNVLSRVVEGLPPRGFAAYATAKHALRGLTLALAAEYSALGIRVFSISPGFMDTELTSRWDSRLVEAVRSGGACSSVDAVARRILELVDGPTTAGRGEDYPC